MNTRMPTGGHSASAHLRGHKTGGHKRVPTPRPVPRLVATSVATRHMAIGWTLVGVVGVWFAVAVLTISKPVCLMGLVLILLLAGAYLAGWVARGRCTDGR